MPTTAASSSSHYHLDLQPQKDNVFVTQLHAREDNEDIRRFPIVKESADKLLRSGINTLQSTSLLRQAVDVEHVDRELAEKREEFRKRMEVCKAKEEDLKLRRQKIRDRVTKFDRFLKENEAKRNRALKKYQQAVKENKTKRKELVTLNHELQMLKKQNENLKKRLQKNKTYESYLTKVIDILPEDYLEMAGDSMIQSIIQRHEGLSATNQGLVERNHTILSGIEEGQKEVDDLRREINKQKLLFNSELSCLQNEKEKLLERNKILEQRATNDHQKKRNLMSKLGLILMGIDNLAQQSHRRHWPSLPKMTYTQKLSMVQEYFLERMGVENMVRVLMAEAETESSVGHSSFANSKSAPRSQTLSGVSKRHGVLPPIGKFTSKKSPSPSAGNEIQHVRSGGNFLERLTAIAEV